VSEYARFWTQVRGATWSAATFGCAAFLWRRRSYALELALELDKEDTSRYVTLWDDRLLAQDGFRDELRELRRAWGDVQASAAHDACGIHIPRQQNKRGSLSALFREADALNDLLHFKLHEVCKAHGGIFQRSDVKTEARALQKVFRTYGGHWWRLSDLCRSSLVFEMGINL
jgi:hypothetical protein